MRQLINRLLILLFLLVITCIIIEYMLRQIPNDYTVKRNYLDSNAGKIEVLFLGGSHSLAGLNPALTEMKSFNASNFSQTLEYDLAILRKYKNNWSSLKYIVLPISLPTFYLDLESSTEHWRAKNYILYYDIKISKYPPYYTEILNGLLFSNIMRIYYYYSDGTDDVKCSDLGWINEERNGRSKDLDETGMEAAKRHFKGNDKCFDKMTGVFNSIIDFADSNDIKLVLFSPPAYKSYKENINQAHWARTRAVIDKAVGDNRNCSYIELMNDQRFTEEHFYDGDHLNSSGAELLTMIIDSLINSDARKL